MIRAVALDLDGVVYSGEKALPGAVAAVGRLRQMGLQVWFVTNNSARSRAAIAAKLERLGVSAREDEVMSSGYAVGLFLRRLARGQGERAVVVGSDDLCSMITAHGFKTVPAGTAHVLPAYRPARFLVVGMDLAFSYDRIRVASETLADGALFVACNRDATYPVENGRVAPGCGPMVAAIECAARRPADYVVGKPSSTLLELAAAAGNLAPEEMLVVGDTPESDIAAARSFGSPSILIAAPESPPSPAGQSPAADYRTSSLAEVPELLASRLDVRQP